jgi:hypothetical protein
VSILVLHRAQIAQGGMESASVVNLIETVTIKGPNGAVSDLVTSAAIENANTVAETRPV